ncbi:MAG: hypothetical protein M1816_004922 [Peltula sp. TS41687]|nr:MAG: hypothetical protein M1816_004922 [Peltula sp. TS41687]
MDSDYPPALTTQQFEYLLSSIKDWSIAHGFAVRPPTSLISSEIDPERNLAMPAPLTVFPSLFPRACFEEAWDAQKVYNELYAAIVRDEEWLASIIEEILDVDDFIAKLWEVHLAVKKEGYAQNLTLGLFRSDYMVHLDPSTKEATPDLKQVEFNTIASSFGGLSQRASELHKYLVRTSAYPPSPLLKDPNLPQNATISELAQGLAIAHQSYESPVSIWPKISRCVIILVQDTERNIFDQKHLEYQLQTNGIDVFRLPFSRVLEDTRVVETEGRRLIYHAPHLPDSPYEVTVVYYRAGYSPDEYSSPIAWTSRLQLERSAAVKCPSILTHLAGSKKIQQVLATPSSPHLARFLRNDPHLIERVRRTFTNIYPLDDSPAGLEARSLALDPKSAHRYVLKPQREGGGNNVYRTAIPSFLQSLPERNWKSYILMEIIEPPTMHNVIYRNGGIQSGEVIGELGIYGICLWRQGQEESPQSNWTAGYLLRTKGSASQEGGVAAGFGCVDSCLLVDV